MGNYNRFIGTETVAASGTTPAPATDDAGFEIKHGGREVWMYVYGTAAPSTKTASGIPWVQVLVDPPSGTLQWLAMAPITNIPLDGTEVSGDNGQVKIIDTQGNVAKRWYVQWTSVTGNMRASYYSNRPSD